jgi:hypothetical protein
MNERNGWLVVLTIFHGKNPPFLMGKLTISITISIANC